MHNSADRIRGVFDALTTAPARASEHPTFVFAHVPSPHAPWVFAADGSPRTVSDLDSFFEDGMDSTGLDPAGSREAYAGQLVDTDRRLMVALDRLDAAIAVRGRPAVTIVFSDHGTDVGSGARGSRMRFLNLLAVRAPGDDVVMDPGTTLVNLMPDLLDQLFDIEWSPRPDTAFELGPGGRYDLVPVDDPNGQAAP